MWINKRKQAWLRIHHNHSILFALIFLLSVPIKLYAARDLVWDIDFVPVIANGQTFFDQGIFPARGTLSSVAAYNMPFLVWLQMPVMFFTRDVPTILVLTQLIWNLIGTWFVYKLGDEMFDYRVGLIGALLFTFSETGISSAYTAWAQLLLPTFYIMVMYCLYRWLAGNNSWYAARVLVIATAAFMTHFSAILLCPTIFILFVLIRPTLEWKRALVGGVVSLILLTPYLLFQVSREFVDMRAFLTRTTIVDPQVMTEFQYLKPGSEASESIPQAQNHQKETQTQLSVLPTNPSLSPVTKPTQFEQAVARILSVPGQYFDSFMLVFGFAPQSLREHAPFAYVVDRFLNILLVFAFFGGVGVSLVWILRTIYRSWNVRRKIAIRDAWLSSTPGRFSILFLFIWLIVSGLIISRNGPAEQPSYFTGIISIQAVMVAFVVVRVYAEVRAPRFLKTAVLVLIVAGVAGLGAADRFLRVNQRDYDRFTPLNVWRYQPIYDATAWIAGDWRRDDEIVVSYDIMPEARALWWVAPWHTVDPSYRIGMSYDYLLSAYYGLENQNRDPVGIADDANYIVVWEPGLERYNLNDYEVRQFNAIFVLKPVG